MSLESHIKALEDVHRRASEAVKEEHSRPCPDSSKLRELKKARLKAKDNVTNARQRLRRETEISQRSNSSDAECAVVKRTSWRNTFSTKPNLEETDEAVAERLGLTVGMEVTFMGESSSITKIADGKVYIEGQRGSVNPRQIEV